MLLQYRQQDVLHCIIKSLRSLDDFFSSFINTCAFVLKRRNEMKPTLSIEINPQLPPTYIIVSLSYL
jgi:hypothetical protein